MNRAIAHGSQNWRLCLKKHFSSLSVTAVALLAVCSVLIHPSGAMKAQRSDKPLLLDASFDPQVVRIIERSCQNCHSERTEWPLYSYVVPMSWMIENDVKRGRSHMNFSRWNGYPPEKQQEILSEMSRLVRNRVMPLPRYLLLHPEARLSDVEVEFLYQWAGSERKRLKAGAAATSRR
jgi:Haem-binding domain